MHGVVQILGVDDIAVEQTTLGVSDLSAPLLVDEEPLSERLGLDLEETSELLDVHGGVQLEVAADHWAPHVVLDLFHEDGKVVLDGINVDLRVVEVWWGRGDEPRAGSTEKLLEDGQGLGATTLHADKLFTVLLLQSGVDGVIETGGVEGNADGDKGVHLIALLGNAVVLGVLLEVLGAGDVDEDVGEHADGIGIAVHHHVRETDVVVGGEVGSHDAGEHGLLVQLNVVEGLESKAEIAEQTVHAQKTDEREVTQHLVQRTVAVLASVESRVLATLLGSQLLADLRPLDERVKHVEHAVASPGVGVLAQNRRILLVVSLEGDLLAVCAEAVELVDEFVDDFPCPVVLCIILSASCFPICPDDFSLSDERTEGTSRSTGPSLLRMKWKRLQ